MATGSLSLTGTITGLPTGSTAVNIQVTLTDALPDTVNLASGFNTVAIPTGFSGCLWAPPATNTQIMTFKGVTGDTGRALHKTRQELLWFDSGVVNFGITAGADIAGVQVIWLAA